jgi:sorting nexin-4
MYRSFGVSEHLPSARAPRSFGSDDGTASSAAPAELLHTFSIWDGTTAQTDTPDTLEPQTKPDFDFDDEHSPTSSIHSSVIDLSSTAASDSDFDVVEGNQQLPQADGQSEYTTSANRPSSIAGLFSRTKSKARRKSRQATDALPELGLPGTTAMDAGSSSANYDDSDWQQAGQNADAQDLAGPGVHGFLECTVSSPQKEGEGTQNAYISYLVTTEVRISRDQEAHWYMLTAVLTD